MHGGSAPQVKAAAQARIQALVFPALTAMEAAMTCDQWSAVVAAAKDILDRAGHKATDKHELTGAEGGPVSIRVEFIQAK